MPLALPFDESGELEKNFASDVLTLCRGVHFEVLPDYITELMLALSRPEVEDLQLTAEKFSAAHASVDLETASVSRSLRALKALATYVADDGLTSDDIRQAREGLKPSFEDSDEVVDRLVNVVDQLVKHRKNIQRLQQRGQLIKGILPMLDNVVATIDARLIWSEGEGDPLTVVPLATILLDLDAGTPDSICFQVTPIILQRLIEELQDVEAALKIAVDSKYRAIS
jgi:hypothetical protein